MGGVGWVPRGGETSSPVAFTFRSRKSRTSVNLGGFVGLAVRVQKGGEGGWWWWWCKYKWCGGGGGLQGARGTLCRLCLLAVLMVARGHLVENMGD